MQPKLVRLSQYFLPTLREAPAEAQIVSHQLMLRAGMIRQASAGIYSWLPLGFRMLKKIEQVVREEQDRIGAAELLMPTIQSADLWRQSGRYDDYGKEMLRIKDRHERDLLYGPTNEELITEIFRAGVKSYRDVPKLLYHIQWKFRDEIRPRFGVMRGREFYMKDAYSFDINRKAALDSYNKFFIAYLRTFARMGLRSIPMRAETGLIGGNNSHEFIILADTGESQVFCHRSYLERDGMAVDDSTLEARAAAVRDWTRDYAATEDEHDIEAFSAIPEDDQVATRGIEIGHIFYFGTKYSVPLEAQIADESGANVPVHMGSYGVGVSRLLGAIIEARHDEKGIVWPAAIAPFQLAVINVKVADTACRAATERIMQQANNAGFEVLYDDRDQRAGVKFAEMELLGIPWRVVVSPKALATESFEVTKRRSGVIQNLGLEAIVPFLCKQFGR
ncbi:MAG: proline--tRNA ligase [Alphaproteobacteria bacterium]|nr:proline--tRNA ligase [Alphaproteobacteria bacterium]